MFFNSSAVLRTLFCQNSSSVMSVIKRGISPNDFYCGRNPRQDRIEAIIKKQSPCENIRKPKFMSRLLGPSKTWKVFKKQQEAIDCCLSARNGLMPFAYEDVNGRRMFLAAHPKVFWALNSHRFFKNCCSYEVIKEYSACKLYLDIEFEYEWNNGKNGSRMLDNLLHIINFNLKDVFNVICTNNDILDLDSSSDSKFSHHVIYEIKNVAFQHNYAVGNFIKQVCGELKVNMFFVPFQPSLDHTIQCEHFSKGISLHCSVETSFLDALGKDSKLQEISEKYGLPQEDILELFIKDQKGQIKLFVDEGVYTKNRHFRLLGSSKLAKRVPLRISEKNKYMVSSSSEELDYFLDSLVTYFSWKVDRVLEFEGSCKFHLQKVQKTGKVNSGGLESNVYPQVDSFIRKLISPKGWIRKIFFFSDSSTIVYDIQGYRYCHNIKREHKNNNIKYVVDLKSLSFYQKCYDPDCATFRSDPNPLPEEIKFLFEDDSLFVNDFLDFEEFYEQDFVEAVEKIEKNLGFEESVFDEDLNEIVDCTEAILDSW